MAFIPVPNVAQIKVVQTMDGQRVINDLYFEQAAGPITSLQLANIAVGVADWWGLNILLQQSTAMHFDYVEATDLTVQNGLQVQSLANSGFGAIGGDFAPNNVALCVSFRTGQAGRSFRGRNYIGGVPDSQVLGNTFEGTWVTDILTAYNNIVGPGALGGGWEWVVVSRFTGGAPRATGIATPVLTAIVTDTVVDSQRRRLPGRGV